MKPGARCAACGSALVPDGRYCATCGTAYPRFSAAVPSASGRVGESPPIAPTEPGDLVFAPASTQPGPPESVLSAVRLMYAGAIFSVISAALGLTAARDSVIELVSADGSASADQAAGLARAAGVGAVAAGCTVQVGLWLWLAYANRRGHRWARTAATAVFVLAVLVASAAYLYEWSRESTDIFTRPATGASAIVLVVGLAAVASLWQPDAMAFFGRGRKAERA